MRPYRFGRIAALFAAVYAGVAVVSGVLALVTGDPSMLRAIVAGGWDPVLMPFTWWVEILLAGCGILQGWAYWQILRGRTAGEPAVRGMPVRLLRAALYLGVGCVLLDVLPIPYQWWLDLPFSLIQFAVVWLFVAVLDGVIPRWLGILALVAGLSDTAIDVAATVAYGLGHLWDLPSLGNVLYLLWLVPVLIGQARDGRWSRATVRLGVISVVPVAMSSGSYAIMGFGGVVDYGRVVFMVLGVLSVVTLVWTARSAHDLGGPLPEPSPRLPAPRAPRRPWVLAAVAVALPLVPAAVNLGHGMPFWTGPRGAVETFFREYASYPAGLLWLAVDALVGVGVPAVLVLVAVARRTRRLLNGTMLALACAAAAGVISALTARPDPPDWELIPELAERRLALYPDGLFGRDADGQLLFGLSPLWYSAALAASAAILFLLYATAPVARPWPRVLAAALATSVALFFIPAADQWRGTVTTAADCTPPDPWVRTEPVQLTGERAFICVVRTRQALDFPDSASDQMLLVYGRRLCGAYTRDDPRELARFEAAAGVRVRDLDGALAGVCPAADAAIEAQRAAADREFAAFEAEERAKCDATPRHRPRIKPVRAIRLKEPEWPEAGLVMYDEAGASGEGEGDDLVTAAPGQVIVSTSSDLHVCVTLETYRRRPPVETKGWDHVTEVGYRSSDGMLIFSDGMGGTLLPDLSLDGRAGHYRIRVHFAWFPWKGEKYGTQRLLIMAYPGKSDKFVTYRKPARRR